ncbi:MAG: hypothetical protein Q8M92_06925 [Candidatus Subteraquimicrobiales bacterium]|nr:hypothetical protein [Candidatus Subteraquimicrobiales bacterium]
MDKPYNPATSRKFDEPTRTEWAVKCTHCGHQNIDLGVGNIGKQGLMCRRCHCGINPRNGAWVDARPGQPIEGYQIDELCVPLDPLVIKSDKEEEMTDLQKYTEEFLRDMCPDTPREFIYGNEKWTAMSPLLDSFLRDVNESIRELESKYAFNPS